MDKKFFESSPWDVSTGPDSPGSQPIAAGDELSPEEMPTSSDELTFEQDLTRWRQRADALWQDAQSAGDLRTQASALSLAFRGLQAQAELQAREKKSAVGDEHPLTLEALDEIIRQGRIEQAAKGACCSSCGRPYEVDESDARNNDAKGKLQ